MNTERRVSDRAIAVVGATFGSGLYDLVPRTDAGFLLDNGPLSTFVMFLFIASAIHLAQNHPRGKPSK